MGGNIIISANDYHANQIKELVSIGKRKGISITIRDAQKLSSISRKEIAFIKGKLGKDPYNGDVFLFMSRNRRKLRMVHYENNAFYMQSKTFKKGYRFMKIEKDESGRTFYEMSWKDVVALLECPVIEVLKLSSSTIENAS